MARPNPMFMSRPFSGQEFDRLFLGDDPRRIALFAKLQPTRFFFREFDFEEDTINTGFTTAVSGGGGPTAFAANAQRCGAIRGATGTTDNDATAVHYDHAILDPADNPWFFIRFKLPAAVTGFSFEIGLSDPKTDEALPGVTDVDTPASGNGVTDMVCLHMDTDQTLVTPALVGVGTSTTILKTNINTARGGSTVWTPTASKWCEVLVGARVAVGYCSIWENGVWIGGSNWSVASGPDTAVLLRPYALFRARNTTTKQIDIDYCNFGSERLAA